MFSFFFSIKIIVYQGLLLCTCVSLIPHKAPTLRNSLELLGLLELRKVLDCCCL